MLASGRHADDAPNHGLRVLDLRGPDLHGPDHIAWQRLCGRAAGLEGEADRAAREVIAAVRDHGDAAVTAFTARHEGRDLREFELSREHCSAAASRVPNELREALALAAANIRAFHETQRIGDTGLHGEAIKLTSRARPLARVAVYAPGGTAAYPSSVLMAAIPAKVAGVREVILLTPRPSDVVLCAAQLAGVDRVFAIGGAQAIAAVALGTAQVPRVDKIVGPGNAYVTAAKRQVFGLVDIDGIAGPSEILVLADRDADPALIAADLLAQAEHDILACALVVTDDPDLVPRIQAALTEQIADLPRQEIAARAIAEQGAVVLVSDRAAMVAAANAYAPEHLELLVRDPRDLVDDLHTAGAIFVGPWTPEAAGDYTAGPSHVLPTAGAARFASPLGVWDFIKITSILELSAPALRTQATAIARIARAEGLEAHARAVELRLRDRT